MRLVLAGGGHAQLAVLAALRRQQRPDLSVTLVSPEPEQIYSGMLPGWMAGHYKLSQCLLPLAPLAEAAGVRFRIGRLVRVAADARRLSGSRDLSSSYRRNAVPPRVLSRLETRHPCLFIR